MLLVTKEKDEIQMKYDTFKQKLAKMLTQTRPENHKFDSPIDYKNGSKLFSLLEKDLLGTLKLCN